MMEETWQLVLGDRRGTGENNWAWAKGMWAVVSNPPPAAVREAVLPVSPHLPPWV